MQRTLCIIKPDGIQRCIVGDLVSRFERKGLKIVGLKMMWVNHETAEQHYQVHKGRFYYDRLIRYITDGPVIAMVLEGEEAISVVRSLAGATDPLKAAPGTIRGDYCTGVSKNLVHTSDGEESAHAEISLFFGEGEIFSYRHSMEPWLGVPDK